MSNYYNSHHTIRPDELEEITGTAKEVWYQRIWADVADGDYLFVYSRGNDRSRMSDLHLPGEWPHDDFDGEPNEIVECGENVTTCRNHSMIDSWKYKCPSVYPIGFKDICSYCLYEYVYEYDSSLLPSAKLGHGSDVGDVHG